MPPPNPPLQPSRRRDRACADANRGARLRHEGRAGEGRGCDRCGRGRCHWSAGDGPDVADLLAAAVAGIGGAERPGQVTMAEAVERTIRDGGASRGPGGHRNRQVTGLPGARGRARDGHRHRGGGGHRDDRAAAPADRPRPAAAGRRAEPLLGRAPMFAILKGRRNYLCLYRLRRRRPGGPGGHAVRPGRRVRGRPAGAAAGRVGRPRPAPATATSWCPGWTTGPGGRSRSAPECIGAQRCPFGRHCFAEKAREAAGQADIVVTNHALLAIDALEDFPVLPEHDVVIIDEAHDLVNRVTTQAAADLSAPGAGDRGPPLRAAGLPGGGWPAAGGGRGGQPGVRRRPGGPARRAGRAAGGRARPRCATPRRRARPRSARRPRKPARTPNALAAAGRSLASLDDMRRTAERILAAFGPDIAARPRGGLDGPAAGAATRAGRHAAGGPAGGGRAARGAAVPPPDRGADLGHAGPGRLVRAAGPAVGLPPPARGPAGWPGRAEAPRDGSRQRQGMPTGQPTAPGQRDSAGRRRERRGGRTVPGQRDRTPGAPGAAEDAGTGAGRLRSGAGAPGGAGSAGAARSGEAGQEGRPGLDRAGRRLAVRPPAQRHPLRRPPSAAARPGRPARRVPHRAA